MTNCMDVSGEVMVWMVSCAGGKDQVTDRMECLKTGGADRSVIEIGRVGIPKSFQPTIPDSQGQASSNKPSYRVWFILGGSYNQITFSVSDVQYDLLTALMLTNGLTLCLFFSLNTLPRTRHMALLPPVKQ